MGDVFDGHTSLVSLPSHLGQLSLLPSVGRKNEYRPKAVMFCGWGGNGRLWKRCGLPSITLGASPLPAQDHETEMSTAPWRRISSVCATMLTSGSIYLFLDFTPGRIETVLSLVSHVVRRLCQTTSCVLPTRALHASTHWPPLGVKH